MLRVGAPVGATTVRSRVSANAAATCGGTLLIAETPQVPTDVHVSPVTIQGIPAGASPQLPCASGAARTEAATAVPCAIAPDSRCG